MQAIEWPTDAATYHAATQYVSHSGAESFRKSRGQYYRKYVACTEKEARPTPALLLGGWLHAAALEPELYETAILPTLKAEHMAQIHDWVEALRRHDVIRQVLDAHGLVEHSIRWHDEATGLELKARRDKVLPNLGGLGTIIADIKTTDDARPESFICSVRKYGYHRQAAWYLDGHLLLTGEQARFLFLVISKTTLGCCACDLPDSWIELGRRQNRTLLTRMAECYQTGDWREDWEKQIVTLEEPNDRDLEAML